MAMELPRVVFFGRSGSDALQFFDLDLADWRGARILADRLAHPESYLTASLPNLPFGAGSFDLVVCGHLLFSYAPLADGGLFELDCFDLAWHRIAMLELLRVSRSQVRLYPAHTASRPTRIHPYVEPLLTQLPPRWAVS